MYVHERIILKINLSLSKKDFAPWSWLVTFLHLQSFQKHVQQITLHRTSYTSWWSTDILSTLNMNMHCWLSRAVSTMIAVILDVTWISQKAPPFWPPSLAQKMVTPHKCLCQSTDSTHIFTTWQYPLYTQSVSLLHNVTQTNIFYDKHFDQPCTQYFDVTHLSCTCKHNTNYATFC